ncbi:DarT1-associated NADAR antitoxin family protein [Tardiphaga sp. 20_F10_N6_6]|uniref:DarT1-associated NADAR antitoxin family protein n=1 Tax=Tardiphaga sp. 20_F10_N6_6 TaxID=3240788 RepID=UPI003F8CBEA4
MAERPVFVPTTSGRLLVEEIAISFKWHSGLAASQKKKNVAELHLAAAETHNLSPLLEISSKSEFKIGRSLSAFHLKTKIDERETTVECAFQGSKVFEHGGPFEELYWVDSREAKRDERLKTSGRLVGFRLHGTDFPLSPPTVFYDWLYFGALYPHRAWISEREEWMGFTDIEFNPQRSINCQARSFAAFICLLRRDELDEAVSSFETFKSVMDWPQL